MLHDWISIADKGWEYSTCHYNQTGGVAQWTLLPLIKQVESKADQLR
jgi:hypothetical protein